MSKVLVVDDSPMIRTLLRKLVEKRGHETYEAGNYDQTIEQLGKVQPDFMFLDIIMDTNRSGIEVLKKVKNEAPDTIVVMVTSISDQEEVIKECVDLGADEYISKPFREDEILNTIDANLS